MRRPVFLGSLTLAVIALTAFLPSSLLAGARAYVADCEATCKNGKCAAFGSSSCTCTCTAAGDPHCSCKDKGGDDET